MSRHYLLDGYNILNQASRLAKTSLEEGRRALINWIAAASPQGSGRNKVTVVFDGSDEHFGGMSGGAGAVVFTSGESADDYIKRLIEEAPRKSDYVVVSDDKAVKLYARALGAAVLSVREFAGDFLKPAGAKAREGKTGGRDQKGKFIPLTQQQKINQELEKLWLKDRT